MMHIIYVCLIFLGSSLHAEKNNYFDQYVG